jgi:integrase
MIPKDVQAELGKMKYIQSLKTESKPMAQVRALPLIAKWKAMIRQARGETDAVIKEALSWKRDIANEVDDDTKETLQLVLSDRTEALIDSHGTDKASQFYAVATGRATLLRPLFEEWKGQIGLAPKTMDQMCRDVEKLVAHFIGLEKITPKAVKAWVDLLASQEHTHSSLERILKSCRSLWRYLKQTSVVDLEAADPFQGIMGLMSAKVSKNRQGRVAFTPEAIANIYQAAKANDDQPLADMIALGAYTGARINELANITVQDVTERGSIIIRVSKTEAGTNREVPIHPAIKGLVARLVKDAKEGFIVPTNAENQYGNRGDVLGKRFGRLKKALGYTQGSEVFHSIRKTLITLLENAGVPEGAAADIVGHKKQTITYGLYSMGSSLDNKRDLLAKAVYPRPLDSLA